MKKKIILWTACLIVVALLCGAVIGCTNETPKQEASVKFLVMGDSIGEALLGPSPLEARDLYAYCTILGVVNGYEYHNRAVSGHMTSDLLKLISREEDTDAYTRMTLIKEADIIDISILGNDFLLAGVNEFAIDGMQGDYSRAERILAKSYDNICGIIDRIYELNPDVTLVMQTLYNPLFKDSIMFREDVKRQMEEGGFDAYEIGRQLLDRLNDVLRRYLASHPGRFYIADVNRTFDLAHQQSEEKLIRYMYSDCVHPSNEGHAAIFATIQTVLEEIGKADHDTAIQNYRAFVVKRLKKFYKGTSVDVTALVKEINAAETYQEINDLYFDATFDVVPMY